MPTKKILCGFGVGVVLVWFAAVEPYAQTVDQRVFFTFSRPVELPGVGLAAGKYLFHLPDPTGAQDVVQVLSADGKHVYGMFFTLRVDRVEPASKPEVRFMETAAGTPPAIKTYWMPGERTGREFIYPKEHALRLAKNASEPVLTTRAQTTKTEETHTTALSRVSSKGAEIDVAANAQRTASTPAGASQEGELAPASIAIVAVRVPPPNEGQVARTRLPKTSSAMPLVGLIGLCFLAVAGVIRVLERTDHV